MPTTFTSLSRDARDHVLRIAHRGASAYAPENSLQAFEKAAEMGADMVEIDVRVTADEVPIVTHDSSLRRLYGINAAVSDLPLAELRELIANVPEGAPSAPIPTFAEVARICADLKLGLYLDIKELTPAAGQTVFAVLAEHGLTPYSVFASFRPDAVAELKHSAPNILTAILFASTHVDPVQIGRAVSADFVHPCWERFPAPHTLLTSEWMGAVRAASLGVMCWHEERPEEIKALAALGVDGICSDTPDVLTALTGG